MSWPTNPETQMPTFERVIPLLAYQDIPAAHDFLVEVFGFESGGVHHGADGQAVHGEVRAGDTAIWLHRVTAEHRMDSPLGVGSASSGLVVYVDDVDAHLRARPRGRRAGERRSPGHAVRREYEVLDAEGHRWWFATPRRQP